ncbi:MAG: DUF4339 domain-containing protein [Planctomycetales bacterium]|nr:DUF4339 domain-containing protein [Planctomycetales bacterium]
MGIRFLCPNGHKLNVKDFLAGKRGICPDCGAKFIVPEKSTSGELLRVAAVGDERKQTAFEEPDSPAGRRDASSTIGTRSGDVSSTAPKPPTPPSTANPSSKAPDPIAEAPHATWYVRPPSGGQFGPATADVMRTWLTEGRVAADGYVWRDGWAEWKLAQEVFRFLKTDSSRTPTSGTTSATPAATPQQLDIPIISAEAPTPASQVKAVRRKSNRTSTIMVSFLAVACIILFVVLILLIERS